MEVGRKETDKKPEKKNEMRTFSGTRCFCRIVVAQSALRGNVDTLGLKVDIGRVGFLRGLTADLLFDMLEIRHLLDSPLRQGVGLLAHFCRVRCVWQCNTSERERGGDDGTMKAARKEKGERTPPIQKNSSSVLATSSQFCRNSTPRHDSRSL
jgi:hypothetical protein